MKKILVPGVGCSILRSFVRLVIVEDLSKKFSCVELLKFEIHTAFVIRFWWHVNPKPVKFEEWKPYY